MKKILVVLVSLVMSVSMFAKTISNVNLISPDTIGLREWVMDEILLRIDNYSDECKNYNKYLINKNCDIELPILYKQIQLYDKLCNEYKSLNTNDKIYFLKTNKLKIIEIGFNEIYTITNADKIFGNSEIHDNIIKYKKGNFMATVIQQCIDDTYRDIQLFSQDIVIKLSMGVIISWDKFINGFKKFGFSRDESIKIANNANIYEDINGNAKYLQPSKPNKKSKLRKSKRTKKH